jgi:hypothetical protein
LPAQGFWAFDGDKEHGESNEWKAQPALEEADQTDGRRGTCGVRADRNQETAAGAKPAAQALTFVGPRATPGTKMEDVDKQEIAARLAAQDFILLSLTSSLLANIPQSAADAWLKALEGNARAMTPPDNWKARAGEDRELLMRALNEKRELIEKFAGQVRHFAEGARVPPSLYN